MDWCDLLCTFLDTVLLFLRMRWELGTKLRVRKVIIMAENPKINVVVKTSKNKETIQTDASATILEVWNYESTERN